MQAGAPAHSAKATKVYRSKIGCKEEHLITWPANYPDLNHFENLWVILKRRIYENRSQFQTKNELWLDITDVAKNLTDSEVEKLIPRVNIRLLKVIRRQGKYINI